MIKSISLLFIVLFWVQDPVLKKQKLTEYLGMEVSTELRAMSQQELSAKLLGARIPDIAMTDEQSAVEFTVTASATFWKDGDEALMKDFYDASIPSLFQEINFIQKDLVNINGTEFVAYEFVGKPATEDNRPSEERYTYLLYKIHKNGLVAISFSCPPYLKSKWQPIAQQMFKTTKFR